MTVFRLFQNEAFEPEAISTMMRTHAEVCRTLGLDERNRPEIDRVARTIIEFAQRGARNQDRLRDCVLQALRDQSLIRSD